MGAAVRQVGNPGVRNRIDHLAQTGQQRHNRQKTQELVLRQQAGDSAFYSGLEKIQQVIADHTIE